MVAVDGLDNVYIGESGNNRVRRIDAASGTITKVAGGAWGFSGDGGAATSASFRRPLALAVDSLGNLYIGDTYNRRIRRVDVALRYHHHDRREHLIQQLQRRRRPGCVRRIERCVWAGNR